MEMCERKQFDTNSVQEWLDRNLITSMHRDFFLLVELSAKGRQDRIDQ